MFLIKALKFKYLFVVFLITSCIFITKVTHACGWHATSFVLMGHTSVFLLIPLSYRAGLTNLSSHEKHLEHFNLHSEHFFQNIRSWGLELVLRDPQSRGRQTSVLVMLSGKCYGNPAMEKSLSFQETVV